MTEKKTSYYKWLLIITCGILFVICAIYFLPQEKSVKKKPILSTVSKSIPSNTTPEMNENLKDTLNLYLNSPAPYQTAERTEKENDLLMKLSSEFENRIDLPTFIYTFEHSASDRKCSKKENGYECFAKVEKNSGWKIILSSPAKDQLHFEKISWENF